MEVLLVAHVAASYASCRSDVRGQGRETIPVSEAKLCVTCQRKVIKEFKFG